MSTEFKLSYTGSQINEKLGKIDSLAEKNELPTKLSDLVNDSGFITGYTETDPTVPAWAKASTKPSYTASEVGADASGTAVNAISAHNTSTNAHADIREEISDLSATKADKSQGVFYIEGDSSSATDTINKVATWIGSHDEITEYFSGLTILYKVVTAGSTTTTLNINNLGAVAVVRNATTGISTSCPVNGVLLLTYTVDSDGTAYWKTADYDANTKNTAGTSNKTGTKLFLVGGASQSSSGVTTYSNSNVYINTSNQLYSAQGFSGDLTGNADTATKATQDSSGNVITDTYETKVDASTKLGEINEQINQLSSKIVNEIVIMSQSRYSDMTQSDLANLYVQGVRMIAITDVTYTNLVPLSTDADGSIYNGTGYKDNARLSSSGGVSGTAQNGSVVTGFIPWEMGDVIRMKGAQWLDATANHGGHYYCSFYNSSKTIISNNSYISAEMYGGNTDYQTALSIVYDDTTGVTTFAFNDPNAATGLTAEVKNAAYFRINAYGNGADLIVTVNEEI